MRFYTGTLVLRTRPQAFVGTKSLNSKLKWHMCGGENAKAWMINTVTPYILKYVEKKC